MKSERSFKECASELAEVSRRAVATKEVADTKASGRPGINGKGKHIPLDDIEMPEE